MELPFALDQITGAAQGASLTAANNNGKTALDMAIRNDRKSIVAYLGRVRAKTAVVAPIDKGTE
jgi:hypothetical protein